MMPVRVLEDSPIAYYRFDEAVGTTVAIDHSGNANHGTFSPTGIMLGVPGGKEIRPHCLAVVE